MEGGMEGGEPAGWGAQPWPPRVCWVCRLGQAPCCSSAFPSLPSPPCLQEREWGWSSAPGTGGGSPLHQPGLERPPCVPWALGGCWLAKPLLAWKNPTIPGMGAGEVAGGWEQRFHWCAGIRLERQSAQPPSLSSLQ